MKLFQFLALIIMLTSCAPQTVSTIVGGEYNKKKNETEYLVFPYGSTSIPGKWKKIHYIKTSKQQFFENEEKVNIAVMFSPIHFFEFNQDKSKKGFEFIKAYYEWEVNFFENTHSFKTEVIETNEDLKYIIWRLFNDSENNNFDTYFLFGEKGGNANNFSVNITDKWSKEKKIELLKYMYLKK